MSAIHFNAAISDDQRRQSLYEGDLFVYSPTPGSLALREIAHAMASEAFAPHAPELAQFELPVERYVEILAQLKPRFIHDSRCKALIKQVFADLQLDSEETYFDVPRLRTMTHGDYLTAGLAYAFHPHRDTWFSAPPSQINWWIPIFPINSDNTIAFHPQYWSRPIQNSSRDYNYYRWNQDSRRAAAQQIKTDTRKQPQAEEALELEPQLRLTCEAGGIILFSGAQLHSTVRNASGRTRFSIDFRTVHYGDVVARRGAPNIDSACTGTTLRDFLRGNDCARLAEEVISPYDGATALEGELVFDPTRQSPTGSATV